uniref:Uncharacterized protein n=1 Tax=Tanacetum cinerariifolium TaxID=118510 RepID=A0A6L2JS55_TANCI|nr:hypothetical protein [Tanacetum cinerariifolium]
MPIVDIPQGMDTSGSPRHQETMRGTSAQTRSERVLEQPNEPPLTEGHTFGSGEGRMEHTVELTDTLPPTPYDLPLTGGYTPESDEGRLKLEELMDLCTILVEKLETQLKQKRSRAVIHSSNVEEPSVHIKDSTKQGRMIEELDKDKDVKLRSTTKDKGKGIMQATELPKKIKKKEMIQLSRDEELAQNLYAKEVAKETARQE